MRSHNRFLVTIIGVCLILLIGPLNYTEGQIIFNGTYTGADLAAFPLLTPRPISIDGSTLNVGTGEPGFERLLAIPIVPAQLLPADQNTIVSFSLTESPPPGAKSDHDIYVGVTDGTSYTGFGRQDNVGWLGFVINGDAEGSFGVQQVLFKNAGFDATFNGTVATDGVSTTVSGSFGSGSGEGESLVTIDPSRDLTLFILLDHPHESYAIDSLSVRVTALPKPGPPTVVVLGNSGWQVSWDSSLNPFVDVAVDAVTANAVFIEKTAEFIQGKGPGGFPAIPMTFTQIEADAVEQIVINDDVITNSTGSAWTGFRFRLLGGNEAATFNSGMTNASAGGNGFSSSPFDNQIFSPDNKTFSVDGFGLGSGGGKAVIADGTQWFAGSGARDGELYLDVTTGNGSLENPFTVFTLKETPSFVPEPSTIGLLVMGGLILLACGVGRSFWRHEESRFALPDLG